eukprot:TRINITY_DN7018_c0_g1_i3.p1 TRINITY_DN7018_c0_g1~~TRINITY_DN7018_c0_g1_i3.p1  ORF type:complete len:485 (+),score=90.26 TRINITY_DN7018_c0_g1_i3:51-1505(+)
MYQRGSFPAAQIKVSYAAPQSVYTTKVQSYQTAPRSSMSPIAPTNAISPMAHLSPPHMNASVTARTIKPAQSRVTSLPVVGAYTNPTYIQHQSPSHMMAQRTLHSPRSYVFSPQQFPQQQAPAQPERPVVVKLGVLFAGRTPENPEESNKIIGKYRLGDTIGEGAYGKVKIGTHIETGVQYAVKSYDRTKISAEDLKRVEMEVKALEMLKYSDQVIKLVDHMEIGNMIYIVMELADDGDLLDFTDERGFIDEDVARPIFQQIVEGIYYCHQYNIIHRDLKLENVLLTGGDKMAKISDFGLSCQVGHEDNKTVCGTPVYRAPEMIQKKDYNIAVDVWSLGVILYAMLHGKFPFYDDNLDKLFAAINAGKYPYPTRASDSARDLIEKMLTPDPAKRITVRNILRHPWLHIQLPKKVMDAIPEEEEERQRRSSSLFRVSFGKRTTSFRQQRLSFRQKDQAHRPAESKLIKEEPIIEPPVDVIHPSVC